ncbi:MAG: energy-coupling factor transporter ATPase [Syntrophomonadaceae bacterium]|nr:energy-coupling factor transporter ATPase [Syntrophomonadaceae bacterium]
MIRVEKVCFAYPGKSDLVLKNISLKIRENEFVAIVGRNGSGKSTLARLLNGSIVPIRGKVWVDDLDTGKPQDRYEIKAKVGLLLPSPDNQIISNLVEEDVAFGPENLGLPPAEIRARVNAALRTVAMEEFAKHPPSLLSGGQKQRVCIAGILAMKPKYMVLDEPTSMLDPAGRKEVVNTLVQLNKREKISLVFITHNLQDVIRSDRIIVMDKGEVVAEGLTRDIIGECRLLRAAGVEPLDITDLIESVNQFCGTKISKHIVEVNDLVKILCQFK